MSLINNNPGETILVLTERIKEAINKIVVEDNNQRDYKYYLFNDLLTLWMEESQTTVSSISTQNVRILDDFQNYIHSVIETNLPDNQPEIRKMFKAIHDGNEFKSNVGEKEIVYNRANLDYEALRMYNKNLTNRIEDQYKILLSEFQSFLSEIVFEQSQISGSTNSRTPPRTISQRIIKAPDRYNPTTKFLKFSKKKKIKTLDDFLKKAPAVVADTLDREEEVFKKIIILLRFYYIKM